MTYRLVRLDMLSLQTLVDTHRTVVTPSPAPTLARWDVEIGTPLLDRGAAPIHCRPQIEREPS
jgi:hypothetical protein